jgi:hypothetical protein
MINVRGAVEPLRVLQGHLWQFDSPAAADKLRAAGGDEFLASHADANVSMTLDLTEGGVWSLRIIDQMSRRLFSVRLGIEDGAIVEIQQSA